jgi:hypothetical protein
MDRLHFKMSVAEARATLERGRVDVDRDGPRRVGKADSPLETTLRVKGGRWEGSARFEDGAMAQVSVWWPTMGRPDQAERVVDELTQRFGRSSRQRSIVLVWRGIKSTLRVKLEERADGTRHEESWSALAKPEQGRQSDDPRFRYHDGWNGFPWGTRYAAMVATVTGTTPLRLGAWPGSSCAEDPTSCVGAAVALRDGERTGTASFHGDRLEAVSLAGAPAQGPDADAIVADYIARFGPPSEDHRTVEHSFRDATTAVDVTVESRQPEGEWTIAKEVTPANH